MKNSYVLLGNFLAPVKNGEVLNTLKKAITEESINWESLVLQANTQMCTPLLFARLKQDDLLQYLPENLQEYLRVIYDSNLMRNEALKTGLEQLLQMFADENIDSILLKGAATFVDELYTAPGSRYMGDLDILIPEEKISLARQFLITSGFDEIHDPYMEFSGQPTDVRHHQIQRYLKPGTPVAIELHFKLAYGQAGRVVETEAAWDNTENVVFRGIKTKVLSPTYRVLHNAIHGLLPHCEYIKGEISLLQLAEFSALAARYGEEVDGLVPKALCAQQNLSKELRVYTGLARELMFLEATDLGSEEIPKWHLDRIVSVGASGAQLDNMDKSFSLKLRLFTYKIYYFLKLPSWFWRNVSYADGEGVFWSRIRLLLARLFSFRSWKKI
ncbi:MAG: nucleotidyltransferase family protein [Porticoccaceae bacterium]